MLCPACEGTLVSLSIDALTVEACRDGCGGVWLDKDELRAVDEPSEPAGDLLALKPVPGNEIEIYRRRLCPKCTHTAMMQHYLSAVHEAIVDECPGCGGYWLDAGELEKIRGAFASEAQRSAVQRTAVMASAAGLDEEAERIRVYHRIITGVARVLRTRLPWI